MLPGLIVVIALGVESGSWAAAQMATQRAADVSAIAGAMNFKTTGNKQTAATFAARIAQLNGGTGTASPSWNAGTSTLTNNQITAQFVAGSVNSASSALKVTVQKAIPAGMSAAFMSNTSYTVSGSGTAELVTLTGAGSGGQPCLLALSPTGTISGQGSTYWTMPSCTVRSNGTIDVHGGGGPLTTGGIYAGGAINIDTWITTTGGQHANAGTVPDPYASNTTLQNAMTTALALSGLPSITCSGVSCTGLSNGSTCALVSGTVNCTLRPGNYGGFAITGGGPYNFTFQPGLYLFKGAVTFTASSISNGDAVTIIAAGGFSGGNTFTFNITAPTPAQVSSTGGIPGIAIASQTAATVTISGSATFNIAGVAYFPNAIFDASGSNGSSGNPSQGNNSVSCLEIIALSIKLSGYSDFNSNCASLGATSFSSIAGTSSTTAQVVH